MLTRTIALVLGVLWIPTASWANNTEHNRAARLERAEQAVYHIFDRATTSHVLGGGLQRSTIYGMEPPRSIHVSGVHGWVGWSRDDFSVFQSGQGIQVDLTVHGSRTYALRARSSTIAKKVTAAIAPRIQEALASVHAKSVPFKLNISVARTDR